MFRSECREFPSAPCLEGKENLMAARVSTWLKLRASLTCFRARFFPGRAKDLSALRYAVLDICLGTKTTLPSAARSKHGLPFPPPSPMVRAFSLSVASRSHRVTHTTFGSDSSGQVISPKQRPVLDDTQYSQDTGSHAPGGIRARNPSKRADRAATRAGHSVCIHSLTQTQLFHSENISNDTTYDILAQSILGFNAKTSISDIPN